MNALEIWFECRRRGITLTANEDRLSYRAHDADAVDRILPLLKRHKPALLVCVRALQGLPVEDGPFLPWGPYLTPELVSQWQRDLFDAVYDVAEIERWSEAELDQVISAISRQPISTLRPDLAHFRERLATARKEKDTSLRR